MSAAEVITLGCRLNIAESAAIRAMLADAGDLIVVNSCAVTGEAVRETRKAIRRAKRTRPDARIFVTGCASEIDRAGFGGMAEVAGVVANAAKLDPALYGAVPASPAQTHGPAADEGHARAFVAVQNGCDHACTFCIIPQGRGASRSLPAGAVVEAVRDAVAAGRREVVLTGVDVTAYGADLPGQPTLGLLVERILRLVPTLERLRLSSLDPCEIDARLIELIASEPRVMPHLHLSLQAGSDLILKRMRRRHARGDAIALVARLKARRPEIAVGADLIAGFPTETDAAFAETLAILDDCDVVLPHIFPFSPREGTPAARMPQLARDIVKDRARRLREAGARRHTGWLEAHVGSVQRVLIERDGSSGHAEDFARVALRAGAAPAGEVLALRIVDRDGDRLVGEQV